MRWHDLTFLHWSLAPQEVAATLPPDVAPLLDTFEGRAWVSLVAFRMTHVGLRGRVRIPGKTRFGELNLRTYIDLDGQPAIWFYSLDAGSRFMVEAIRRTFRLPYLNAKADVTVAERVLERGGELDAAESAATSAAESADGSAPEPAAPPSVRYDFARHDSRAEDRADAFLRFTAKPRGVPAAATFGTVDHFLAERYVLASRDRKGRLAAGHVHHAAYPLQDVAVGGQGVAGGGLENGMLTRWPRLDPQRPERVCFARRLDVVGWPLGAK